MSDLILAYDLGTTGIKATLFTTDGVSVRAIFCGYDTTYPRPGWAEQRPADWWDKVIQSTRELLEPAGVNSSHIAAIGLSGHMMGCLPVTDRGTPLCNAIIHADTRSTPQCEALEKHCGGAGIYRITGQRLDPHYPLPKVMWLHDNAPEILRKTRFIIQCKDYVAFRLTGNLGVTDFSDASLTAFYDVNKKDWSDPIVEAARLDRRLFPAVVPSKMTAGHISAEAARLTGLCEGTPVVVGAGDGACATLGAGVVEPGYAYNYIGGTSWIGTLLDKPDFDPGMRLFTLGSAEYGRFCAIGTIQSAGSSLHWLADEFCLAERQAAEREGVNRFDVMDRLARQSPPGAERLVFLPYMMGERTPIWDPAARGVLLGLTLAHKRADLVRAVMEGVASALRSVLDVMGERGMNVDELRVIGGGAKSDFWLEILASVYGRTLRIPEHPGESTSLGAALVAGVGVGAFSSYAEAGKRVAVTREVRPVERWMATYEVLYPYYQSLYPILKDSYGALAQLPIPEGD